MTIETPSLQAATVSRKRRTTEFSSLDTLSIERGGISDFSVPIDGLRYDCRLNDQVIGDRLYVVFNGAVNRDKYTIPVFARWNWHSLFNAPVLAVSDPLLNLDPKLRIGWFVGTRESVVPVAMAALILRVASSLAISADRVICYGSSSGGFAAVSAAAQMPSGKFVAYNPQVDLLKYYKGHVREFSAQFDASRTPLENATAFPKRWALIPCVRDAFSRGIDLRGVVIQNTLDVFHHDNHFLPFCGAFGLPQKGGISPNGRLISALYSDERGHGPENVEVARRIVEECVPELLDKKP